MLTGHDIRGYKRHFVVVSINIHVLRVSVDRSVGKCVLLYAVLLMCPSIHFPSVDRSIHWGPVRRFLSVDRSLRVSVDRSVGKCVPLSALLIMCTSFHFVLPLIN